MTDEATLKMHQPDEQEDNDDFIFLKFHCNLPITDTIECLELLCDQGKDLLVSGTESGLVQLWSPQELSMSTEHKACLEWHLPKASECSSLLSYASASCVVTSGGTDLWAWDLRNVKLPVSHHNIDDLEDINAICWVNQGKSLLLAGDSGHVACVPDLLDSSSLHSYHSVLAHPGNIAYSLAVSPSLNVGVSGGMDCALSVFFPVTSAEGQLLPPDLSLNTFTVSEDAASFVGSTSGGSASSDLLQIVNPPQVHSLSVMDSIGSAAGEGVWIAAGLGSGVAKLWVLSLDQDTRKPKHTCLATLHPRAEAENLDVASSPIIGSKLFHCQDRSCLCMVSASGEFALHEMEVDNVALQLVTSTDYQHEAKIACLCSTLHDPRRIYAADIDGAIMAMDLA